MRITRNILAGLCFATCCHLPALAADLPGFTACVEQTNNNVCELDAGLWVVSDEINVNRSDVTLRGQPGAVLKRRDKSGSGNGAILPRILSIAGQVTGIQVENLTFDGNRAGQGITYPAPATITDPTDGIHKNTDAFAGKFQEIDVHFGGMNPNCWRCVTFSNVTVLNSPGYGINITRSGVYVQNSKFELGFLSAIQVWNPWTSPKYIEIYWNDFDNYGGGAISVLHGGTTGGNDGPAIGANSLYNNHREFPHRSPGGQILIAEDVTGAVLFDNWINGNYANNGVFGSAGLEIYGKDHDIARNQLIRHRWFGIYITNGKNIQVRDGRIESNQSNGVNVSTYPKGASICTEDIVVQNNDIKYNTLHGFHLESGTQAYNMQYLSNAYAGNNGGSSQYFPSTPPPVSPGCP